MPCSTLFGDDIILTDGRKLLTLKDATDYITKLQERIRIAGMANGDRGADAVQSRRRHHVAAWDWL